MQLTNVFVSFLLAAAVSAKGKNGTQSAKAPSVKAECNTMAKLTKDTALAANDTKLAAKFDNNQTKIDAFKAKVSDKSASLSTMMANATLMSDCAVIAAHEDAVDSCNKMASIEKMVALAANTTKLSAKLDNNATKISAFTAKASTAATKLTALQSNGTLSSFCATQSTLSDCKVMSKLQKEIKLASNTTALDAKFKGNQTKIAMAQAMVTKAQAKLDALMANSTLMDTCTSVTKAGTTTNGAAAAATTTAASLAGRIEATGGMIAAAVLALSASMLML